MQMLVSSFRGLIRAQGVLLGLILLMCSLFLAQTIGPAGWYYSLLAVPIDVAQSWNQIKSGAGGMSDWLTLGTLLTCEFLHGDIAHLATNMVFFWIFGALVSELLGWRWLIVICLLTAIGASITHVVMNHDRFIPVIGASGIVAGYMGAYLGMALRWHLPYPHVWPMARPIPPMHLAGFAAVFVAIDYVAIFHGLQDFIAHGAHVGGFTTGLFFTALVVPKPKMPRQRS